MDGKALVHKALIAGCNTSAEGVVWISKNEGYSMRPQTFGNLAARIRREGWSPPDPVIEEAKKRSAELEKQANERIREMDLATAVAGLLRRYSSDEVHRMVGIVSAVQMQG